MAKCCWLALIAVSLALLVAASKTQKDPTLDTTSLTAYKVLAVVDGDTIKVRINGEKVTVRIIGVDTPETKDPRKPVQRFGKEASAFTADLLEGEKVYLEPDQGKDLKEDCFGRTLAHVWRASDKLLVALKIIREGYGFYYSKYPFRQDYMDAFRQAERDAREQKRGLWKDEGK